MITQVREIVQSPLHQGAAEQVSYRLTTTVWGGTPSGAAVTLKTAQGVDVSATKLSGAVSTVGDVITTPLVIGLTPGEVYRLEIQFTSAGNTLIAWATIIGEA